MAVKVFLRLAGLDHQEQPAPISIDFGTKWTAVQQLLASYYGGCVCPGNLDVRYWDEEDYVILSSQEELEEAIRLAQDKSYLQIEVQLKDVTDSSANQQKATSSSASAASARHREGDSLEEPLQRRAYRSRILDLNTAENSQPLGSGDNFQSKLDTATGQQNTGVADGATAMDSEEEMIDNIPLKVIKRALKRDEERTAESRPAENTALDYYLKRLGDLAANNPEVGASQPDVRDVEMIQMHDVSLELAAQVIQLLKDNSNDGRQRDEESADQEPTMLPGALSGANAIAIEMPEMEHHGIETAEPADMAETGEMSTKSSRDAETGFWMQPRLDAEITAELKRRLSTLVTEKERSQFSLLQKKPELKSSRKDKKKHRAVDTSSEDTVFQKKGKSSSSNTSSSFLEVVLKEESSSDTLPPIVQPNKKHERKCSHKSDSKKKKHSTEPLTEDLFVHYMTKFEAQLKKDLAKEVTRKTVRSIIKNLPRQSEGGETSSNPVSSKRAGYVHEDIICDCCDREIVGIRYICGNCPNYDLCEECENIQPSFHDRTHVFIKLRRPCLKAGTRHGIRIPLLKRVIYSAKEEERRVDPDRLQVIMERTKGHESLSRNNNNEEDRKDMFDEYSQPSLQDEVLLYQADYLHRVGIADVTEPSGCMDGSVPLDLTKKNEPLENKMSCSVPSTHDDGIDKEEDADGLSPELNFEEGFVVCPPVQTSTEKQETCREKLENGSPLRETSSASSIEVVDTEQPFVPRAVEDCYQAQKFYEMVPQHASLLLPSFKEWLDRNHSNIQEGSCFTSLSDAMSGDEDFVVITPDCFDTSKPFDPNRFSVLCKKAEKRNTARLRQDDEAHSDQEEEAEHSGKQLGQCFNKQEAELLFSKQEKPLLSKKHVEDELLSDMQKEPPHMGIPSPAMSPKTCLPIRTSPEAFNTMDYEKIDDSCFRLLKLPTETGAAKVPRVKTLDDANGNVAAGNHLNTLHEDMPPCFSQSEKAEEEKVDGKEEAGAQEDDELSTSSQMEIQVEAAGKADINQNMTPVSHSMPEDEPLMEQEVYKKSSTKDEAAKVQNHYFDDDTEEEEEEFDDDEDDDDDDADTEEADLKHFPKSDEEGATAAADSLDPNQQLNRMMTTTFKVASSGLQTLIQTGKDIFRTFQQGDSYEHKESSYEFKPSDYKLPKSSWQPSSKEYIPPKSNFQLGKSEYQIPKSTYKGIESQVPAGAGIGGEYAGSLQRIREMGYFNNERILELLKKHGGDVQVVVNELVEESDNSWAEHRHG